MESEHLVELDTTSSEYIAQLQVPQYVAERLVDASLPITVTFGDDGQGTLHIGEEELGFVSQLEANRELFMQQSPSSLQLVGAVAAAGCRAVAAACCFAGCFAVHGAACCFGDCFAGCRAVAAACYCFAMHGGTLGL